MTQLSPEQIAQYAIKAGFRGDGAVKAVAVALAESGGRTDAVNRNSDKYRSIDRGLWQINSKWHPEVSAAAAFNPAQAAAHAYRISNGGKSWSPWSTWKNGSALTQIGRARLAVAKASKGAGAQPAMDGPLGPKWTEEEKLRNQLERELQGEPLKDGATLSDLAPDSPLEAMRQTLVLAVHAAKWIGDSHNWTRVAFVIGGAGALLLGASMLANQQVMKSDAVKALTGAATNVLPTGKAAKAVGAAAATTPTPAS